MFEISSYEIHPVGHSDTFTIERGRQAIESCIARKSSILSKYNINQESQMPPVVSNALGFVREEIARELTQSGIPTKTEDVPHVVLVWQKDLEALDKELGQSRNKIQCRGSSNITDGKPMTVVSEDELITDLVGRAFHETLHFVGSHHFASFKQKSGEVVNRYIRQGFEILEERSPHKSWVLEEGFVAYREAGFKEKVGRRTLNSAWEDRKKLFEMRKKEKLIDEEDRMEFSSGATVEVKYCNVRVNPEIKSMDFVIFTRTAFAGSLFEAIIAPFTEEERNSFINLLHKARRDITLVPEVARRIDTKHGKGTYFKLLRLPDDRGGEYKEVWELINEIRKHST